ncbi:uncharacterized protein [Lepeophtheirus salmonis]|nr:serine-rich adhesin for platelets-like [Lepeophtheirus salmonis]
MEKKVKSFTVKKVVNNDCTDASFSDVQLRNECEEKDGVITMITTHEDALYKTEISLNELICNEAEPSRTSNDRTILDPINEDSESNRIEKNQECIISCEDLTIILRATYKEIPDGCEDISSSEDERVACTHMKHVCQKVFKTNTRIQNQSHFKDSSEETKRRASKYSEYISKSNEKWDVQSETLKENNKYENINITIKNSEDEKSSDSIQTLKKGIDIHDDKKSIDSQEKSNSSVISMIKESYGNGESKGTLEGIIISIPKKGKDEISKSSKKEFQELSEKSSQQSKSHDSDKSPILDTSKSGSESKAISEKSKKKSRGSSKSSKNVQEVPSIEESESKETQDMLYQEEQEDLSEKDSMSTNESSITKSTELSESESILDSTLLSEKFQNLSEKISQQSKSHDSDKSPILDASKSGSESKAISEKSKKKSKGSSKSSKNTQEVPSIEESESKETQDMLYQEEQEDLSEKDSMSTNESSITKSTELSESESILDSTLLSEKFQNLSEKISQQSKSHDSDKSPILDASKSGSESKAISEKSKKKSKGSSKSSKNTQEVPSIEESKSKETQDMLYQEEQEDLSEKDSMSTNESSITKSTELSESESILDSTLLSEKFQNLSEKISQQSKSHDSDKSPILDASKSGSESKAISEKSKKKSKGSSKSSKNTQEVPSIEESKSKETQDMLYQEEQEDLSEKDSMSTNESSITKSTKLSVSILDSTLLSEKFQNLSEKISQQSKSHDSDKSPILDTSKSGSESKAISEKSKKKSKGSSKSSKNTLEVPSIEVSKSKETQDMLYQEEQEDLSEKDSMSKNESSITKSTELSESESILDSTLLSEKFQNLSEKISQQSKSHDSDKSLILDTTKSRSKSKATSEKSKKKSKGSSKSSKNEQKIQSIEESKSMETEEPKDKSIKEDLTGKVIISKNESTKTRSTKLSDKKIQDVSEKSTQKSRSHHSDKSSILATTNLGRKSKASTHKSQKKSEVSSKSYKSSKKTQEGSSNGKSKTNGTKESTKKTIQISKTDLREKDLVSLKTKSTKLSETDSTLFSKKLQGLSEKSSQKSRSHHSDKSPILDNKSGSKSKPSTEKSPKKSEVSTESCKSPNKTQEESLSGKSKTNQTKASAEKSNDTTSDPKNFKSDNYKMKDQKSNPSHEKKSEDLSIDLNKFEVSSQDSISSIKTSESIFSVNTQDSIDYMTEKRSLNKSYQASYLYHEDEDLVKDFNDGSQNLSFLKIYSDKENTEISLIVASVKDSSSCFEENTTERLELLESVEISQIESFESHEDQAEGKNLKQINYNCDSNQESNPPSDHCLPLEKLDDIGNLTILSVETYTKHTKRTDYGNEQLKTELADPELKVKSYHDLNKSDSNSTSSSDCESSSNKSTSETTGSGSSSNKSTSEITKCESSSNKSDSETSDSESNSASKIKSFELSSNHSNLSDTKEYSSVHESGEMQSNSKTSKLSITKLHLSNEGDSNNYLEEMDSDNRTSNSKKKKLSSNNGGSTSVDEKYDSAIKKLNTTSHLSTTNSSKALSTDFKESCSNQSLKYKHSNNKLSRDQNKYESNRSVSDENDKLSPNKEESESSSSNMRSSKNKYFSKKSKPSNPKKAHSKTNAENSSNKESQSKPYLSIKNKKYYSKKSNKEDHSNIKTNISNDSNVSKLTGKKSKKPISQSNTITDEKLSNTSQKSVLFTKEDQPIEYWLQSTSSTKSKLNSSTISSSAILKEKSYLNKEISAFNSTKITLEPSPTNNLSIESFSNDDNKSKSPIDLVSKIEDSSQRYESSNFSKNRSQNNLLTSDTIFQNKVEMVSDFESPITPTSTLNSRNILSINDKPRVMSSEITPYKEESTSVELKGNKVDGERDSDAPNVPKDNSSFLPGQVLVNDMMATVKSALENRLAKCDIDDIMAKIFANDAKNKITDVPHAPSNQVVNHLVIEDSNVDKNNLEKVIIDENIKDGERHENSTTIIETHSQNIFTSQSKTIQNDELLKDEFVTIIKNPHENSSQTTSINQISSSGGLTTHQMDKSTPNQSLNLFENKHILSPNKVEYSNKLESSCSSNHLDETFSEENIPKDKVSETVTSLLAGGENLQLNTSNDYLLEDVVGNGSYRSKNNIVNADNSEEKLINRSDVASFGRTHIRLEDDPCRTDNNGIVVDYQDIRDEQPEKVIDIRLGNLRARHVYEIVVDISNDQLEVDVKDITFSKQCAQLASIIQKDDTNVCCVFYLESNHDENLERCLAINVKNLQTGEVKDNYSIIFHAKVIDQKR